MFAKLKKLDGEGIAEIAIGVFIAVMALRLLSVLFGKSGSIFSAEDAEDLENFGGRARARQAGRQENRSTRKDTRAGNEDVRMKRKIAEGKKKGSAKKLPDYEEPEGPQEEEVPDQEEYNDMLEMAEYFDSLDAEDIENMDAEEAAEYAEYLEMMEAA